MRIAFARTVGDLAETDHRIVFLTGDLGFMALETYSDRHPDRFINVGVAEQNMIGVATGMAEAGFIPFCYSIVTFASLRPYEFIRNGPVLHQLPVRVAGVGGGFEYGTAGATHHGLEDIGVMRLQPGLTVIAPADAEQTRSAVLATWDLPGPIYYRLGKDDRTVVPSLHGHFELGRASVIRKGNDLLLVSMGAITAEAAAAAEMLADQGLRCEHVVVSSLNPAPVDDLAEVLGRFAVALTVEAHYACGGIGSLVSEVVAERGIGCRVVRCAVRSSASSVSGSQRILEQRHRLNRDSVVETALMSLQPLHT
jgi:transketolase